MEFTAISHGVKKSTSYEPTSGAVEILRALAQVHYLTVEQVVRLYYKPGTITTVQSRMNKLFEARYCERRPLPVPALVRGGSGAYVYTLGTKGRSFVDALGLEVPARFRPSEIPQKNQLSHIVACSDVYVAAMRLCRERNELTLERLVHERVLRAQAERVEVDGRPRRVTPDGWFSIVAEQSEHRFRSPIALELDLGTERQVKWRDKVAGLLAWIDGPYERLFATPNVTVAVVCPGRLAKHAEVLCSWTEAELAQRNRREDGKLFLFTGMNPAAATPYQFLIEPAWRQPFAAARVALIDLELEAGGG